MVLKVKIEECHKVLDKARTKLSDCLKKKEELKNEIKQRPQECEGSLV